jgi:hypothetical protein
MRFALRDAAPWDFMSAPVSQLGSISGMGRFCWKTPHPDADGREESASALQRSAVAVLDLLDERQQVENGRCLQHDAESKYHAQKHPFLSSHHGLQGRAMTPLMVPCSLQSCLIERHGHFRQQCRRLSKNSRIPPICPSVWE